MNALARKVVAVSTAPEEKLLFAFRSRRGTLCGFGAQEMLQRGSAATIGDRVGAFFAKAGTEALIAGALPFDRDADDYLWQAGSVRDAFSNMSAVPFDAGHWQLRPEPDAAGYAAAAQRSLDIMAAEAGSPEALAKIVLARSLVALADRPIDLGALLDRLATDPAVTAFLVPLPDRAGSSRALVGATPELLLSKTGSRISSHPLAGSARRQKDIAADAAAAAALGRSDKDRREHQIVVEFILDTLAPHCHRLLRPEGISLTSTNSMWHLGTRIEGDLKDETVPAVVLAAALHPTPAVCGLPRDRAARLIGELEPYERDFYAGTVGWCDGRGDGAWYVTIRCAEICGCEARLYAGAGIVPGSDPWAEAEETGAKFGALLSALGIDMQGKRI